MSVLSTASIYEWFQNRICGGVSFADLEDLVKASPPGAQGLLMLPHFQGRGSPDWNADARGVMWGLTLNTTRADIARAILEGIAAEIANQLDIIRELTGKDSKVIVGGGLSRSTVFNQIQADMYGSEVHPVADEEATLMGAWLAAAVALGHYADHCHAYSVVKQEAQEELRPIEANVSVYRVLREKAKLLAQSVSCVEERKALRSELER
jgi:sugar (pentulose or hexulose) kinase